MKFNSLIPEITVKNIDVSKAFYINLLGFTLEYERKNDKFAFVSYQNAQIMLCEFNGNWETGDLIYPYGRGINFQIQSSNSEELRQMLISNNYKLYEGVTEACYMVNEYPHKQREFLVQDPDGYLLRFCQATEAEYRN